MRKVSCDIRDKYDRYQEVMAERKVLHNSKIVVSETKGSNEAILQKREPVTYDTQADSAHVDVEVQADNQKHFLFKLFAKELTDTPIFRFDSYGPRHRNSHLQVPIAEQNVDTPHFHRYTNAGRTEAYKTAQLKNEAKAKELEDISLCFCHFCHEANTGLKNEELPEVKVDGGGKLFRVADEDRLNRINFA